MRLRLVRELAAEGAPVTVTCRVSQVTTSGFSEWSSRRAAARDVDDAVPLVQTIDTHAAAPGDLRVSPGPRRVGTGPRWQPVGRRRVDRLMRLHGSAGVHSRRWRRHQPAEAAHLITCSGSSSPTAPIGCRSPTSPSIPPTRLGPSGDRARRLQPPRGRPVHRRPPAHRTRRRCPGNGPVDALETADWRRSPNGTSVHSDRGTQYTSWPFGPRLRETGLIRSLCKGACAYDNSLAECFFGSMQIERLDRRRWPARKEVANALFEWIECWYNHNRRHSASNDP